MLTATFPRLLEPVPPETRVGGTRIMVYSVFELPNLFNRRSRGLIMLDSIISVMWRRR